MLEESPKDKHRSETWLHILLPVSLGGLLIIILVILVLLLPLRAQVALVADLMCSVLVLCPLALCLLPVYLMMMVMAFGMNKVHDKTAAPLHRLETRIRIMGERTIKAADTWSRRSIALTTKFALLNRVWDVFDRPQKKEEGKDDRTDTGTGSAE